MKIEAGKFYKTRDGRKVQVHVNHPGEKDVSYPWYHDDGDGSGFHGLYPDGSSCIKDSKADLISEWHELTPNQKRTAEMIEVMQAYVDGESVEIYAGGDWWVKKYPIWSWSSTDYRIAPATTPETTPDTIDWAHVAPDFKWMARDLDNTVWLFYEEPEISGARWFASKRLTMAEIFASYRRGTCDWKDSLVKRPE